MIGDKRYVSFTPEEEFFAKGCYGIEGRREIPTLGPTDKNDFLTLLFAEARKNIADEVAVFAPEKEKYEAVMDEIKGIVDAIETDEDATAAAACLQNLDHALTSKKEASALLKAKVTSLGLVWNKNEGVYKPKEK
jgi:exonuclease VII small subunit